MSAHIIGTGWIRTISLSKPGGQISQVTVSIDEEDIEDHSPYICKGSILRVI